MSVASRGMSQSPEEEEGGGGNKIQLKIIMTICILCGGEALLYRGDGIFIVFLPSFSFFPRLSVLVCLSIPYRVLTLCSSHEGILAASNRYE